MKVVMLAELLLVSKSASVALVVAVLTNEPGVVGVTAMVTTALAPTAKLPSAQLIVVVPPHVPCVEVTGPNVTPVGSGSVTLTFVAAAGPLFVMTSLYASANPTCPGFGDAVLVKARSILDGLITLKATGVAC